MKNKGLLLSILLFLPLLNMAQKVQSKPYQLMLAGLLSNNVKTIDVSEAAKSKQVFFIDAREKKEFKVSHLKNAIHVGYDNQDFKGLSDSESAVLDLF